MVPTAGLAVLCGLPGAGKSTVAAELTRQLGAEAVLVDVDALQDEETARTGGCFTPDAWAAAQTRAKACVALLLQQGRTVVLDDAHGYHGMRVGAWQLARQAGAGFAVIYVDTDAVTAAARNARRPAPRRVPDDVFTRAAAVFQPPDRLTDRLRRYCVRVAGPEASVTPAVLQQVRVCFALPVVTPEQEDQRDAQRAAASAQTRCDPMHQADLAMRRMVTEHVALAKARGDAPSTAAAAGNHARNAVLQAMRAGECDAADAADRMQLLLRRPGAAQ